MNQKWENSKKPSSFPGPILAPLAQNCFTWILPPLDVRHCCKLSLYAISRKTNKPNLRKWQKTYNHFHNILMFYQIFLSSQFKQCAIITYKHGIYELPNDWRFRILRNYEILGKCLNLIEWEPSLPPKMKILWIVAKKSWKIAIKFFMYCAISHKN